MKLTKDIFGYIYKITNLINNKVYIGKTKNSIDIRFKQHLYEIDKLKTKSLLHDAIKKYGVDNFKVEEIDSATCLQELNDKERFYINKYNSRNPKLGYNICIGGEGGPGGPMFLGHKHSLETRAKMSLDRKGEKNANYGNHRKMPEDEKPKHARPGELNGMYGKTHSDESKLKNSLSHLGSRRMSNIDLYPKYKIIKEQDIQKYLDNNWFLLK